MSTRTRKRLAATVVAASLALTGAFVTAPAATAAPTATPAPTGSDLDYFSYAFPGLRADSVFEAVTFERFEYLLGSEGTYAFLIGGPADPTTKAAISHIDAVAAQYGVDAVYTFDPRLDGAAIDIRTTALPDISALWTDAVDNYLNKDTAPAFGGAVGDDPYLFIYDKAHTAGEVEDRIVAALAGAVDAASVATPEGAAAYRAQVAAVFDSVAIGGVAAIDTQRQFTFYKNEINRRHQAQYVDAAKYGAEILADADGADWAIKQITYPELLQVLESDGDHVILFGGTWCHNTRAVIKDVNRAAAAAGVDTVYQFDLRLDGTSSNDLHIRDSGSEISYLYGDVVAEFFSNLRTQYQVALGGGQKVEYHPGGDTSVAVASAKKLQVPYLIEYDKARSGAPIVQDWIRENTNGTFTEYMTEWWWVAGLPGSRPGNVTEADWPARQAQNWAFADEAIAKIDKFFGLASAPAAPAAPAVSVTGADATVSWAAPADGGSALTGYRVALDGGTPIDLGAATTAHTFTGLTAGEHSVTVQARSHVGVSPASSAKTFTIAAAVEPEPEPETPTPAVTVTGDLRPGGSVVVSGSGLPASTPDVTVEIRSTPQTLGVVSTAGDGTFRLAATIPASIAPGAHTVVVLIDGQVVASQAVTVAAGAVGSGAAVLSATGGPGIPFAIIGGALTLILGGAVLQALRRRRATV